MKCPLCEQTEVEENIFLLNCSLHGTFKITKEAVHHYIYFNQWKQKKITEYLSNNTVEEINTRTLDEILRTV